MYGSEQYVLIMIEGMGEISIESPLDFAILLQNASILRRNANICYNGRKNHYQIRGYTQSSGISD